MKWAYPFYMVLSGSRDRGLVFLINIEVGISAPRVFNSAMKFLKRPYTYSFFFL